MTSEEMKARMFGNLDASKLPLLQAQLDRLSKLPPKDTPPAPQQGTPSTVSLLRST